MGDMIDRAILEGHVENANRLARYDWQDWTAQDIEDAEGLVRAFIRIAALPPAPDAVGACPKCGGNREQWLRCSNFTCPGGDVFGRLPTTSSPDAVQALVKAVEKLGLRELVAGWNGENKDEPYAPHSPRLGATIKTTCGVVYEIDAALRALGGDA